MSSTLNDNLESYQGTIVKGYGVASGKSENSPFHAGTITLQKPFFKALGLDLTSFFDGTINIALDVDNVELVFWHHQFNQVKWIANFPAENFRFLKCHLLVNDHLYDGYIYQPIKETKIGHFQKENILEIISEYIPNVQYGIKITLRVPKLALRCR